jgi:hypothetical protein
VSPGDVMDEILTDPRTPRYLHPSVGDDGSICWPKQHPHYDDALFLWAWVVDRIKPAGLHHMPMSPAETERAIAMLRLVLESVLAAKALHPVHFAPVAEGGR